MDNYRKSVMAFKNAVTEKGFFFVFDTETTGLRKDEADIIEFSAIKYNSSFEEVDRLDIYIDNGYPIPEFINELTGISDEEIKEKGLTPGKAAVKIKDFIGNYPILVGYNSISFDTPFCEKLYSNIGPHFEFTCQLDVLKMAREKAPKPHKLADMVSYFKVPDVAFHRAINDCEATFGVLMAILPLYDKEEPKTDVSSFKVTAVKRWTKSETLDRLYVSNNLNESVYYDIPNKEWVTGNLPLEDTVTLILAQRGVNSVEDLL